MFCISFLDADSFSMESTGIRLNEEALIAEVVESCFMVPYERNPLFTGRDIFLDLLHATLQDTSPRKYNHRIAIHGLGGIGKTQMALEYCYRYRAEYDYIFWLHAAER